MDDQILKELKRMNNFLEAIDWKLWNFHNKFINVKDVVNEEKEISESNLDDVKPVSVPTYKKKIKTA